MKPSQERSIGEAKARFAECVRQVERGATIVLTRHGRPVAKLAPLHETSGVDAGWNEPYAGRHDIREPGVSYAIANEAAASGNHRREAFERLLRQEIWPNVPAELRGKGISKQEREEILGYGSYGV